MLSSGYSVIINMKENKRLVIYGLIALVIGFVGWFGYSFLKESGIIENPGDEFTRKTVQDDQTDGLADEGVIISEEDPDTAMLPPENVEDVDEMAEISSVQGTVDSIGDGYFVIEDINGGIKNVVVDDTTTIIKHTSEGTGPREEPTSIKEEKVDIEEITVGLEMTVEAEENIAGKEEFTAKKIVFQGD
jgi:hypothetical protein